MMRPTRIGCGAGFAGDRLEPAVDLVDRGFLDYLVLECLAERTIAEGQLRRSRDPETGYDPLLERRVGPLLPHLARTGAKLVSNIGAANPTAAARRIVQLCAEGGFDLRVAVITGDDVLSLIDPRDPAWEDHTPLDEHGPLVSANAYLGAESVVAALALGADIVIAGRVADPSLFLGCLAHHRGWDLDDHRLAAHGTLVGHLLECGAQVTGGYFADPPLTDIPDLAHVGMPLAEVSDVDAVITKLPGTGGRVARDTVVAQLTYEVLDPTAYITPDVVVGFDQVDIEDAGPDRVRVHGARGAGRPRDLKVSVGYQAGHLCEAEISYAGAGARARAELAAEVVTERLGDTLGQVHASILGTDPISTEGGLLPGSGECRLRMAVRTTSAPAAARLGEEISALYTNGPAGGGGVRVRTTPVVGVVSTGLTRDRVSPIARLVSA